MSTTDALARIDDALGRLPGIAVDPTTHPTVPTVDAQAAVEALRVAREALLASRAATARAWSAWLDLALDETFEDDGTPVLRYVFLTHPDLTDRLRAHLT